MDGHPAHRCKLVVRATFPLPTFCLGLWLSTSTRALLVGATGLGKTMLGLEIAFAVASQG